MSSRARPRAARRVARFRSARAGRPLWMRALNAAGSLWPGRPALSAAAFWSAARASEKGAPDPAPEAVEALEVLVAAIEETGALNTIGRMAARQDTARLARTHLRVQAAIAASPEILDEALPPPWFIVGWPRTGSTALHTLLAADPESRTIPYWESFDPVPPDTGPDLRIERLAAMLDQLERYAPDYQAIHPMTPEMTEECVALFVNHFRSLQLDFQYRVPGYVDWLLGQDARVAYDAYHRSLRLIHHHRPGGVRLVLKDPTHLVHLETILARWPEAKIVFTHRDPVRAISSLCSLYAHTRAIFSDDVEPEAIGREVLDGFWPRALDAAMALRERLAPDRFVDVRHPDLLRDPLGCVDRIHERLGAGGLGDEARRSMEVFLAEEASRPADVHEHSLAGFGLAEEEIRERFRDYRDRFDLGGP